MNGLNGIKRRLSFNKTKRSAPPSEAQAGAPPRPAAGGPSAPVGEGSPQKEKSRGGMIRRNLSFKRGAKKDAPEQPSAEPASPAGVQVVAASPNVHTANSPAFASVAMVGANIKRTFSWQRAHRQTRKHDTARDVASRGKGLDAAAPTLLPLLEPAMRGALGATCQSLRAVSALVAARGPPPPHMAHAAHTHEGGKGGVGKENQDTFFVLHPSAELAVYAVFDGHGKRFGRLASQVASARMAAFFRAFHRWTVDCPEAALKVTAAESRPSSLPTPPCASLPHPYPCRLPSLAGGIRGGARCGAGGDAAGGRDHSAHAGVRCGAARHVPAAMAARRGRGGARRRRRARRHLGRGRRRHDRDGRRAAERRDGGGRHGGRLVGARVRPPAERARLPDAPRSDRGALAS